jgi:branched-chain amino acid transport system substrate-binding protein
MRQFRLRKHWLALVVGITVFAVACGNSSSGGGADTGVTTLNVGLIDSATGLTATAGRSDICGGLVAADAIGAGAVPGVKMNVTVQDDQSTPAVGARAATALTSGGTKLFIGGSVSSTILAELPLISDAGGLHTGGTSKAAGVLTSGKLVVRLNSDNAQDSQAIADYINNNVKPNSLAIVASQGAFGEGAVKLLTGSISSGTTVTTTFVDPNTTNYQSVITKVAAQKPDAVLLIIFGGTQFVAFFRDYQQSKFGAKLISYPGLGSEIAKASGGATDGVVTKDIYAPTLNNPANAAFKSAFGKYASKHSECPSTVDRQVALTYAQALLLAQAAAKAKSADPATLRTTIIAGTWSLPEGTVTFDSSGQAKANYWTIVGKGGDLVVT